MATLPCRYDVNNRRHCQLKVVLYQEGEVTSMLYNTGQDTLDVQLNQSTEVQRSICICRHRPATLFAMVQYHACTSGANRRPDTCNDCRAAMLRMISCWLCTDDVQACVQHIPESKVPTSSAVNSANSCQPVIFARYCRTGCIFGALPTA